MLKDKVGVILKQQCVRCWILQFLGNITQRGGKSAFVGDYFQLRINLHLVL